MSKKSNPKLIFNFSIEDEEFEKTVKTAVDKYTETIIESYLNEVVQKYVDKKLEAIKAERRYENYGTINGLSLTNYVAMILKPKIEDAVKNITDKAFTEVLAKTLANMMAGGNK